MDPYKMKLESVYAKGEDGEFHLVARRDECETKATAEKEYIEKETVIDTLCGHFIPNRHKYIEEIRALPAADVLPVVRCRDCYWWTKQKASLQGRCALLGISPTGAWFCADGQKKATGDPRVCGKSNENH